MAPPTTTEQPPAEELPNPLVLCADQSPALLPLLRAHPELASKQDSHGYSLVHAAASYDSYHVLEALIQEFGVDVNIKDEDGETALFFTEKVGIAEYLVELGADVLIKGADGLTAGEKLVEDGEYTAVGNYLLGQQYRVLSRPFWRARRARRRQNGTAASTGAANGVGRGGTDSDSDPDSEPDFDYTAFARSAEAETPEGQAVLMCHAHRLLGDDSDDEGDEWDY